MDAVGKQNRGMETTIVDSNSKTTEAVEATTRKVRKGEKMKMATTDETNKGRHNRLFYHPPRNEERKLTPV